MRELIEAIERNDPIPVMRAVEIGISHTVLMDAADGSVDAALTLMRRLLPGWGWTLEDNGDAVLWRPDDAPAYEAVIAVCAGNPARALLLAILKAMEAAE